MFTGFLIHSGLEHWAERTPDAPAFVFDGEARSYAETLAASQRLARALLGAGLGREERVGIFMRKGHELGPAIYGSLIAGGAFVPLDPTAPPERVAFMIRDCGIRHLVSTNGMKKPLSALFQLMGDDAPQVFGVDPIEGFRTVSGSELNDLEASDPGVWTTDQDLAYIMYTSGSTGEPKGMMHSHRGSLSYAR
ncbi:MAG: AMP-binding protein, partial [Planctomycetota bacterium]